MTKEQRVGLFVILALVIFVVFLELTTGVMPFKKVYTVYGLFQNVRGIQEGTDVGVSGINVGKVKGLAFKDGKVEVAIAIPEDVKLYEDAIARLEAPIMGPTSSLNIAPGSSEKPRLKDGDRIDTEESPSIQEVLGRVDKAVASLEDMAESFGGKEGPFAQLNTFFKEHEKEMGDLVENFSKFSERLSEGKGTLGKLIEDDTLYNKATAMMDRLDTALKDLAEVAQKVNRGEGTLGKLVTDDSLYRKAEESLANVDRATKGMEDQGPISAIGAAVGAVF